MLAVCAPGVARAWIVKKPAMLMKPRAISSTWYCSMRSAVRTTRKATPTARTEISVTTRKCSEGSTSWLLRSGRASSQIQTALGATHSASTSHDRDDTAPVTVPRLVGTAPASFAAETGSATAPRIGYCDGSGRGENLRQGARHALE